MDISSIVIGLILLLVFIGPIGFLLIKQKNTGKTKLKNLQAVAQKNQIALTETEILPAVSLGLDAGERKLVVLQHGKNAKEFVVALEEFKGFDVFDSGANGHAADNYNPSEEIRLLLKGKPGTQDESILFFHENQDSMIAKEERLASAKKWSGKLRELVRK